jgi:hypothetical protein
MVEDSDPSDDSPEAQRFRHPAGQITCGCAAYMDHVHELREFVSGFFSMVKSFEPLTAAVQQTAPEALDTIRQRTIKAAARAVEYNLVSMIYLPLFFLAPHLLRFLARLSPRYTTDWRELPKAKAGK